jgi:hypothetical protein
LGNISGGGSSTVVGWLSTLTLGFGFSVVIAWLSEELVVPESLSEALFFGGIRHGLHPLWVQVEIFG